MVEHEELQGKIIGADETPRTYAGLFSCVKSLRNGAGFGIINYHKRGAYGMKILLINDDGIDAVGSKEQPRIFCLKLS